jgi:hypothetical protein
MESSFEQSKDSPILLLKFCPLEGNRAKPPKPVPRSRPVCPRARTGITVLARIPEQYSPSIGGYGRPPMTMNSKEAGFDVGERRVSAQL